MNKSIGVPPFGFAPRTLLPSSLSATASPGSTLTYAVIFVTAFAGAIIDTYRDEAMFDQLCQTLGTSDVRVIKPQVVP